jgi:hypothetical protein
MTDMLHRYYTDHELTVLCQDCARERREAGERCEWAETPGAKVEQLSPPEPPDLNTLMRWMHDDGGCEAACPYGCWVEPDGRCPHGKPSWLIVMGLI